MQVPALVMLEFCAVLIMSIWFGDMTKLSLVMGLLVWPTGDSIRGSTVKSFKSL